MFSPDVPFDWKLLLNMAQNDDLTVQLPFSIVLNWIEAFRFPESIRHQYKYKLEKHDRLQSQEYPPFVVLF
jgi:hypothetical protein